MDSQLANPLPAVDYSSEAVRLRLERVSLLRARLYGRRMAVNLSAEAITRRIVTVSQLRDLCLKLGRINPR